MGSRHCTGLSLSLGALLGRRGALRAKVLDTLRRTGVLPAGASGTDLQELTFREVAEGFAVEQLKPLEALVAQWQKHFHKLRVSASTSLCCYAIL